MILTSTKGSSPQLNRPSPDWLPVEITEKYNGTDLTYEFCLRLFGQLEAGKREKFSPETMRQWFIEFIRRGWTKKMLQERYDALLATKIYGVEKLEISDWINAKEVYAIDEVNLMIKQRIDKQIAYGNFLRHTNVELSEEEKKCIDLWAAKDAEMDYNRRKAELMDDYRQTRRKLFSSKYDH